MKVNLATTKRLKNSTPPKGEADKPSSEEKFSWKKLGILSGSFLLVLLAGLLYQGFLDPLRKITDEKFSLFSQMKSLGSENPLRGEEKDRINILLLGIGGEGHPGGTLTDTIMVASYKPSTKKLSLLSLPRDLVVKYYSDENPSYWEGLKMNHSYEKGGVDLAEEKIEEVTGLSLHYHVLLDFYGFRQIIDDLNGLDIYVDNSFVDKEYPNDHYGYQTLMFKQGWESMGGERALQFARSRHGNNSEGSDFARSSRQQKILEAFKAKAFSLKTLLNPLKVATLMDDLGEHVKTNMEIWEMIRLAEYLRDLQKENTLNKVVESGPDGLLRAEVADQTGAYILVPRAGDYNYSEIHTLAENIFETDVIVKEEAKIVIQNGTKKNGLAAQMAERLQKLNLNISSVVNAPQVSLQTLIYDFSNGKNPKTLQTIEKEMGSAATTIVPASIQNEFTDHPDILIILGQDLLSEETPSPYET